MDVVVQWMKMPYVPLAAGAVFVLGIVFTVLLRRPHKPSEAEKKETLNAQNGSDASQEEDERTVGFSDEYGLDANAANEEDERTIGYAVEELFHAYDGAPEEEEHTVGLQDAYSPFSAVPSWAGQSALYDDEGTVGLDSAYGGDDEKTVSAVWVEEEQSAVEDGEETINPYSGGGIDEEETINPYAGNWKPRITITFRIEEPEGNREETISFTESMQIGRSSDCELCMSERYISRKHIQLSASGGRVSAVNLSTEKTGDYTMLNHEVLGTLPIPIKPGDEFDIVQTRIRIESIR